MAIETKSGCYIFYTLFIYLSKLGNIICWFMFGGLTILACMTKMTNEEINTYIVNRGCWWICTLFRNFDGKWLKNINWKHSFSSDFVSDYENSSFANEWHFCRKEVQTVRCKVQPYRHRPWSSGSCISCEVCETLYHVWFFRVIDITSFEKHLESSLDHTLNYFRNLVIFRSKNICQKESLTRSSTVI